MAEIKAFETGAACAKQAIPQLTVIAAHMPGHEARFWDAFVSGVCGAVAAQIGFDNARTILKLTLEAIDKTEADVRKATTTHH